jgi:hypothetical protein
VNQKGFLVHPTCSSPSKKAFPTHRPIAPRRETLFQPPAGNRTRKKRFFWRPRRGGRLEKPFVISNLPAEGGKSVLQWPDARRAFQRAAHFRRILLLRRVVAFGRADLFIFPVFRPAFPIRLMASGLRWESISNYLGYTALGALYLLR